MPYLIVNNLALVEVILIVLKGEKETISLVQAKGIVPGPNCILKSL